MKPVFALALLSLTLYSCRSVNVESLVAESSLAEHACVPRMKITMHQSLEAAFPKSSHYAGCGSSTGLVPTPVFGVSGGKVELREITTTTVHNAAVSGGTIQHPHMFTLARQTFVRHMEPLFSDRLPESNAQIYCKVSDAYHRKCGFGWACLTLVTLGTSLLIGAPCGYYEAGIQVEIEIRNPQGVSVAAYKAEGNGSAYSACYWGFSDIPDISNSDYPGIPDKNRHIPTTKAAYVRALSDALSKIITKMQADSERLRRVLSASHR